MSNRLAFGLLLTLPLWGGQPALRYPVALYTQYLQEPPAAVVQALQDEVELIMAPMAANLEWRPLDQVKGNEVSSRLAVVKFLGGCVAEGPATPAAKGALGWTHLSEGAIIPFCDIDCSGIRHYLREVLPKVARNQREEAYGRAVGRVLAHELYHIFANTVEHGTNGVGKGIYSVEDLISRDFHFAEREASELHHTKPRVFVQALHGTH